MDRFALATNWRDDHPTSSLLDDLPSAPGALALTPLLRPATLARLRRKEHPAAAVWLFAVRPPALPEEDLLREALPTLTVDKEMRQRARQEAQRSLQLAVDLETPQIVVPLYTRQRERAPRHELHRAALALLEQLAEDAWRASLRLCLPRGEEDAYPTTDELQELLRALEGAPLAYWHTEPAEDAERYATSSAARPAPSERQTESGLFLIEAPPDGGAAPTLDLAPSKELLRFALESGSLPPLLGGAAPDLSQWAAQRASVPPPVSSELPLAGVHWTGLSAEQQRPELAAGLRKRFPRAMESLVLVYERIQDKRST